MPRTVSFRQGLTLIQNTRKFLRRGLAASSRTSQPRQQRQHVRHAHERRRIPQQRVPWASEMELLEGNKQRGTRGWSKERSEKPVDDGVQVQQQQDLSGSNDASCCLERQRCFRSSQLKALLSVSSDVCSDIDGRNVETIPSLAARLVLSPRWSLWPWLTLLSR